MFLWLLATNLTGFIDRNLSVCLSDVTIVTVYTVCISSPNSQNAQCLRWLQIKVSRIYPKSDLWLLNFNFNFIYRVTQIKTYSWDNAQVILVGNKCDMEDERIISFERGKQLADQLGVEFFETSAKENVNVKVSTSHLPPSFSQINNNFFSVCFRTIGWHYLWQNVRKLRLWSNIGR